MKTRIKRTLWMATAMLAGAGAVSLADKAEKKETYPIDVCIVSGMKLGSMGEPYEHEHDGRTVYFCCAGCINQFEANAEELLKKLDREIIAKQKENYPLTTCVVSGEELGSHGAIIDIVHDNRLVRLCCEGCLSDFEKDPAEFLKMLDDEETDTIEVVPVEPEHHHEPHRH